MWFENFMNAITEFFNTPVPIICCSVGALVVGAGVIISKTSIGKKLLNKVKTECGEAKQKCIEIKDSFETFKVESIQKLDEYQKLYEEKLALVEYNRELERQFLIDALSQIHNKNIESLIEEFKNSIKVNDISEVVNSEVEKQKIAYEEEIKEFKEQLLEEYKNEIAKIDTKTTEINEKVNDVVENTIGE